MTVAYGFRTNTCDKKGAMKSSLKCLEKSTS
jgi:hypothetical protein